VNEAYLRLIGHRRVSWVNRAQFFGVAAQIMRRILVDHARDRHAAKREGGVRVTLDDGIGVVPPPDCEVIMLDQALRELGRIDERQARIVELKYFAGLSEEEVAAVLSLSRATISREWQSARAWMYRRMTTGRTSRG
jgi:RNA polymerase sigma factor (TIGR02999 family)